MPPSQAAIDSAEEIYAQQAIPTSIHQLHFSCAACAVLFKCGLDAVRNLLQPGCERSLIAVLHLINREESCLFMGCVALVCWFHSCCLYLVTRQACLSRQIHLIIAPSTRQQALRPSTPVRSMPTSSNLGYTTYRDFLVQRQIFSQKLRQSITGSKISGMDQRTSAPKSPTNSAATTPLGSSPIPPHAFHSRRTMRCIENTSSSIGISDSTEFAIIRAAQATMFTVPALQDATTPWVGAPNQTTLELISAISLWTKRCLPPTHQHLHAIRLLAKPAHAPVRRHRHRFPQIHLSPAPCQAGPSFQQRGRSSVLKKTWPAQNQLPC
jgi:hypothetical protein